MSTYVPKNFKPAASTVKVHVTHHPAFTQAWAVIEMGKDDIRYRPAPGESEVQFMQRAIRYAEAVPHVLEIQIFLPMNRPKPKLD